MLRVKDLDLERGELRVRRGKGGKDRVTVIPETVRGPLREHLAGVKALHDRDLGRGGGWVEMPGRDSEGWPYDDPYPCPEPGRPGGPEPGGPLKREGGCRNGGIDCGG
jgi:hypothetical protein